MSQTKVKMTGAVSALLIALVTVPPVLAHHSFATEYDRTKPVAVTGVVRKVDFIKYVGAMKFVGVKVTRFR